MRSIKRIGGAVALGTAVLFGVGLAASPAARAHYIVTFEQQGSNVVATGSGSIDLTSLRLIGPGPQYPAVEPYRGEIATGLGGGQQADFYTGFTGPASFGTGGLVFASSGSGDIVGILVDALQIAVPSGYVSGDPLSNISTYDKQTFASLGITPGTYAWTWGSGASADSFTVDVPTSVPEPSTLWLLVLPLGFILLFTERRRRTAQSA